MHRLHPHRRYLGHFGNIAVEDESRKMDDTERWLELSPLDRFRTGKRLTVWPDQCNVVLALELAFDLLHTSHK
jgi:hypothetical protein